MTLIEDSDPLSRAVISEADLVALPLHTNDHVPDPAPAVEPTVEQAQLGRVGRYASESEGDVEQSETLVRHGGSLAEQPSRR